MQTLPSIISSKRVNEPIIEDQTMLTDILITSKTTRGISSPSPSIILDNNTNNNNNMMEIDKENNHKKTPESSIDNKNMDWILTNIDQKSSQPQTLHNELERLKTLRSYQILDSEREIAFERLTGFASRLFNVPIALVSLVDLGRQWFMSNRGLGDVRETPRNLAFCAHAVISDKDIFIVKDATKDFRFKHNPLVTGPPNIRFYAGAPLWAPEGFKIGTFCIIDTVPRPNGFSLEEKQNLQELSALAVQVLVARRTRREREHDKNSQQLVACAAHDLLTPLSGIELSLDLLVDDQDLQKLLNEKQKQGLKKAAACSNVLQEICRNVRSTFSANKSAFELAFIQAQLGTFKIDELVDKLYITIDSLPKKVPLMIKIDDDVPKEIVSDSAKIFRCAMIYLTVATARTEKGAISMRIKNKIRGGSATKKNKKSLLYVACEDTASPISVDCYDSLFKPFESDLGLLPESALSNSNEDDTVNPELALFSVACLMNVVGGEFGFHPRSKNEKVFDNPLLVDGGGEEVHDDAGSVFWFSIPYSLPCDAEEPHLPKPSKTEGATRPRGDSLSIAEATQFHQSVASIMGESLEGKKTLEKPSPTVVVKRKKRALVIEDSTVVRKMLTKLLTKLGYEVTEAENGLYGLGELKSSLFDVVLCDFLMPVMDGLDCVQQYRAWECIHRSWLKQWIVGISAHASEADIEKGLNVGMNHYMPKPIKLESLSSLLESNDQTSISKRLDELDAVGIGTAVLENNNGYDSIERSIEELAISSRCSIAKRGGVKRKNACLLLCPDSSHTNMMQKTIRDNNWESALVQTDQDAWMMLKMRTWELVLVDESFTPLIVDFREWESQNRGKRVQGHVFLMKENMYEISISDNCSSFTTVQTIITEEFDGVVGKPLGMVSLTNKLQEIENGNAK